MKPEAREILLIYDENLVRDRKALALAQSLAHYRLRSWNIRKERLSEKQIAELAQSLQISIKQLVARKSAIYKERYQHCDLDEHDWLTALKENPDLLRTPIILFESVAKILDSGFDLIKEDMSHRGIVSKKVSRQEMQA